MYFEEKVIDGVLCWRNCPDGEWTPFSLKELTHRYDAHAEQRLADLERQVADITKRKDDAYLERNRVVAALARLFPSGIARTAIEGWSEDWHGCVYIDLPTGQVSWHYHDSQAHLFEGLPPYAGTWDGHDTDEKYRRVERLTEHPAQADATRMRELLGGVLHMDDYEMRKRFIDQALAGKEAGR